MRYADKSGPGRRQVLTGIGLAAVAQAVGGRAGTSGDLPPRSSWAEPRQAPATSGLATFGDVAIDYWDTRGSGEVIVLLHPATGSNAIWTFQQPVLARAGYRVIAYSRRGFGKSPAGPLNQPGSAIDDLNRLLDGLGVKRFHLIGSAAGGFVVPDYALSHPDRLSSATLANTFAGIVEDSWARDTQVLTPPGFKDMPADFRELSPSYRIACPAGRARWMALEKEAVPGPRVNQPPTNRINFAALARIRTPTLVLTGDADLYLPPVRARELASLIPGAQASIIAEAGHSSYWEQPDAFNRAIINFVRRHATRQKPGGRRSPP